MNSREHSRDVFPVPPSSEYWDERTRNGWKLVAAEWERDAVPAAAEVPWIEEVPYGLKVGKDCLHLVENAEEKEALTLILETIAADQPLSEAVRLLNDRGILTRSGMKWTQVGVFNLLPRLVDVAPKIYRTQEWANRRSRIYKMIK